MLRVSDCPQSLSESKRRKKRETDRHRDKERESSNTDAEVEPASEVEPKIVEGRVRKEIGGLESGNTNIYRG